MSTTAIFGCTGLVGSHVLSTLLSPTNSAQTIQTISRRTPKSTGVNLQAVVEADTTQWANKLASLAPTPQTVISALGTTRVAAGGIANQWKIDHDLNVEIAEQAKKSGVRTFVFVSSAGIRGFFSGPIPYSQMKRGVEDKIKELDFPQAIILRPGLIIGEREVPHQGGALMNGFAGALGRYIGQGVKDAVGQDAEVIARAAVHAARLADEGKAPEKYWILEAKDIVRLGRTEWKE
ncbi:protein FMP52, mitochondrial [Rhypophila decipiens]